MTRLVFSAEAEADALSAFHFYEDRREGLGEQFRDHLGIALGRILLAASAVHRRISRLQAWAGPGESSSQ